MSGILEFLKMAAYLGGAFLVLAWLGSGSPKKFGQAVGRRLPGRRRRRSGDEPIVDDMGEIGLMGGLGGGEMEDVFVGRHALRRMKIGQRERGEDT